MKIKNVVVTIFICFPILFGNLTLAHVPDVENLPSHPKYFSFYLLKFSQYFSKEIYQLSETESITFKEKLLKINSWNYEDGTPQLLWSIKWTPGRDQLSFDLIENIIPKNTPPSNIERRSLFSQSHPNFPLHQDGKFIFKEFVTKEITIRNESGEVSSVYYQFSNIQAQWLPKKLREMIYKIGYDTRLPLDKLRINKDGEIIAYYP